MSLAEETLRRSYIIVQTLLHQGVSHFCLAPGSRSSPLAEAIYTLAKDSCLVHFDERGLGFYALGLAKASKKPVALLVTSGTAVANLLPAVVEASLSRVPLLLLTADRPFELRDCGANQTIEQTSIFSSYIHWKSDLPLSDLAISDACLQATFSYALWTAQKAPPGPVQINCMIREPLVSTTKPSFTLPPLCRYETVETLPSKESLVHWTRSLSSKQRGIILLGSDAIEGDPTPILELSARLKWPIFSDVLSGGRAIGPHPLHVQYPDLLLRSFPSLRIDAVLQLGDRLVSKTLTTWLRSQESLSYYLASTSPSQQDPDRLATHRIGCSGLSLAKAMIPLLSSAQETSPWLQFWEKSSLHVASFLSAFFAEQTAFTEPFIAHSLEQGSSLFLSNSMPIRDAEFFLFPTKKLVSIFANRGASGIDGNIATACGLAKGLGKPLIAVLGDMASLHDINSLALVATSTVPVVCLIINNQGGGVFSFLPISQQKDFCETCIATAHNYSFSSFAKAFSLPYFSISSLEEWMEIQDRLFFEPQSCIIECRVSRSDNVLHHEKIYQQLREYLCSIIDPTDLQILDKLLSSCTVS